MIDAQTIIDTDPRVQLSITAYAHALTVLEYANEAYQPLEVQQGIFDALRDLVAHQGRASYGTLWCVDQLPWEQYHGTLEGYAAIVAAMSEFSKKETV